jgi:hypothetical protein
VKKRLSFFSQFFFYFRQQQKMVLSHWNNKNADWKSFFTTFSTMLETLRLDNKIREIKFVEVGRA